jgi:chemotaxis protein methyltransferase CheR
MMSPPLAAADYEFIRELVYRQSRINLGSDKTELVRSRVQKRLRTLGLTDFSAYCQLLNSPAGEEELTALLDVISTNVTEFFREGRHFEFLRTVALPAWQNRAGRPAPERYQVWSAACSSGEEPYSLAILLAECFGTQSAPDWRILATDISTRMLSAAQQGIYRRERVKLPEPAWLRAYFQKGVGAWENHFRVKASLRERVQFRHLNLMDWPYNFSEPFHVIFCRNVMIYFDRPTQEQLVPRLAGELVPGGYLVVGHSESLVGINHGLKCVQPSIYQRA